MSTAQTRRESWRTRYPTVADLLPLARRRMPFFVHDFLMGGTGDETSSGRNAAALAGVEVVPRYGVDISAIDTSARLFGRRYAAPLAIAPIGMDGAMWPGATGQFARASADLGIPYMTGTMATRTLEEVAGLTPEGAWFQLYTMPADDHSVSFDLVRRAEAAGVHALAVTLDIPLPARRVRDMRSGINMPFKPSARTVASMLSRPAWLRELARHGPPRFANLAPYAPGSSDAEVARFARGRAAGGAATWELLARIRDVWPRALMVKGVMHPGDARRAAEIGADGIVVSNHGGRQFDASPAPLDVLPAIRAELGPEPTVLVDGAVMSGLDLLKAQACGADGALAGRAFMLGLAALGADGAHHVAETMIEEYRIALGQTGAVDAAGVRELAMRHPARWRAEEFEAPSAGRAHTVTGGTT